MWIPEFWVEPLENQLGLLRCVSSLSVFVYSVYLASVRFSARVFFRTGLRNPQSSASQRAPHTSTLYGTMDAGSPPVATAVLVTKVDARGVSHPIVALCDTSVDCHNDLLASLADCRDCRVLATIGGGGTLQVAHSSGMGVGTLALGDDTMVALSARGQNPKLRLMLPDGTILDKRPSVAAVSAGAPHDAEL